MRVPAPVVSAGVRPEREPRPALVAALVAVVAFALLGIGAPLLGIGVFAGTDQMMQTNPYRDAGLGGETRNVIQNDIWDTIVPNTLLFADALRDGQYAAWNPYILGGVPLGAAPNAAVAGPLSVPYYVLPGFLAPAWVKLVEIAVAVAGCVLFARRLGLGYAAGLLAGLVFASSAFMVVWTNWPHTRTAAFLPFVFWAIERLVQRGRWTDAVLLAGAVAAMVLGGFPSVTGYTLVFAAIYLLVRVLAEHRAGRWGRDLRVLVAAGAGVAAGLALTAVQLVPFASFLSTSLVRGRAQTPINSVPHEALITSIAPFALGTADPQRPPSYLLGVNIVETFSYVGAAALVLVVVAVLAARAAWAVLPRGVWSFLLLGAVLTVVVAYGGGPPLGLVQQSSSLFEDSYIGRLRVVVGFLVAVLAAVGYEALLRRRTGSVRPRPRAVAWAAAFGLALAAVGGFIYHQARAVAQAAGAAALAGFDRQVVIGGLFLGAAAVSVVLLWWVVPKLGGPRAAVRGALLVLLPVLILVQANHVTRVSWPQSTEESFFPVTDLHRYLAAELGHERFVHSPDAMAVGAAAPQRLRGLNGHTFVNERFAEVIEGLPGEPFFLPATLPLFAGVPRVATSPVLDRLGVRYFVASPLDTVFGVASEPPADGSTAWLSPGTARSVPISTDGPLRAVGLVPVSAPPPASETRIEVVLRDGDGVELIREERTGHGMVEGEPFTVAIAAESLPTGVPLTAEVSLRAPHGLRVQGVDSEPAAFTVGAEDDGLRLAHVAGSLVYERLTALPRIRWASESVVETDALRRVELVADARLPPETVVLDGPVPGDEGGSAQLAVVQDGFDDIVVDVEATGGGYLVIADALQNGWSVEVGGAPAEVLAADHGLVAVAVPAGRHTVRWSYDAPAAPLGAGLSAAAALFLVAVVILDRRRRLSMR